MPVDDPTAPRIFGFDAIRFEVQSSRLSIRVTQADDASLLRIKKIAERVLSDLVHTPITGIGLNFSYTDDEPSPSITKALDFAENGRIAEKGWTIHETNVRRALRRDGTLLNLILSVQPDSTVRYDLNFHADVNSTALALEEAQKDIVARKNEAKALLEHIYYSE